MQTKQDLELEVQWLEIPLTFAFYTAPDDEDVTCAHCLELDIVGQGLSSEEARQELMDAAELYVTCKVDEGEIESLFRPAPAEIWNAQTTERWSHSLVLGIKVVTAEASQATRLEATDVRFTPNPTRLTSALVVGQ